MNKGDFVGAWTEVTRRACSCRASGREVAQPHLLTRWVAADEALCSGAGGIKSLFAAVLN